ncbi:Uncharacterised protein [Mycobacteroides abscessus subsp. abscessus]|nr:Uncharacterised protein [Mycobacteroides abscessus subsp. abscessus]
MIGDNGIDPMPPPGSSGNRSAPASAAISASPATVLWSNTSWVEKFRPFALARATSRIDRMLSPPSAKKLSSAPTSGTPSTSENSSATIRSRGVSGRRPTGTAPKSGSGSARRSTLPKALTGRLSSGISTVGTMCGGSVARANRWSSATSRR